MALVQKSFSDIITFSRSSNATRVGPTGVLEYAPHNLLTYSEQFDNAAWTIQNGTVSPNSAASPNGTVTADKVIINNGASGGYIYRSASGLTAGISYTQSIYLKADGFSVVNVLTNLSGSYKYIRVNLLTGVISQSGSDPLPTSYYSINIGNGWWRIVVTETTSGTSGNVLYVDNNGSTGDGVKGFLTWGAQLSVGPYALDYTPTTSAAVYGPRFDYDPVTLAARGLLVEEQRTNLMTYSEDFSNAAWAQSFLTENITANSATSPSGQVTADTIADSVTTAEFAVGQTVSVTANVPYTFSVFAKANGSNFLYLRYYGNVEQYYYTVIFDLSLGTATKSQIGSSASNGSNTITSVGNGWYRLTVTATVNSGTLIPMIGIAATGTDTIGTFGNVSVNGTGNRSCYIWGAQLE